MDEFLSCQTWRCSPPGLGYVEEIGHLQEDISKVGPPEKVAFALAVDAAQAVVIARFEKEMAHAGQTIFCPKTCGNAVVELPFDGHRLLLDHFVGSIGEVSLGRLVVRLRLLAQIKPHLRAQLEEELCATVFFSPSQMSKDGHLNVVDRTQVRLGLAGMGIDNGTSVEVFDVLLPTNRGIIHLGIEGTKGVEVFLADVFHRQSACETAMLRLVYLGVESYRTQHIAAIETYREIAAMKPYLRHRLQWEEEKDLKKKLFCVHRSAGLIGQGFYLSVVGVMNKHECHVLHPTVAYALEAHRGL